MRKMILVYNPKSSYFRGIEREVLSRVRELKGWMVGKYEIIEDDVEVNATRLKRLITDDTLVLAAGGDGTASVAINAMMTSLAEGVRLGVLSYGNFNDTARSLGSLKLDEIIRRAERGSGTEVWPLECMINQKHWRYGMSYFTVGMFAEACAVFDHPKTRKVLQKGKRHLLFSLMVLARWWLKQRKRKFLPDFCLGNSSDEFVGRKGYSDYMAINGATVARIMRGGRWFKNKQYFLSETGQMTRFFKLVPMMLKSIFKRVPGVESDYDCLAFAEPARVMVQAEGEYKMMSGVERIEIRKAGRALKVIAR